MPHELLQRVDAVGADVGADEHVHERIAHLAAPLVQPGAHIVDAGPRKSFGLGGRREKTQKEVADLMGISQSYISRLEKRIMLRLRREISRQICS